MEGKRKRQINGDQPIAKPRFPLPQVFEPGNLSEATTEIAELRQQRAHFYRKEVTGSGTPVYGFCVTVAERAR